MEAVAEAVMDMRAIPLGNKANVDMVEMWNVKGQYSLESQAVAFFFFPPCSSGERLVQLPVMALVMLCE